VDYFVDYFDNKRCNLLSFLRTYFTLFQYVEIKLMQIG